MSTIAVLSGPERRRRWSLAQKLEIVAESLVPGANVTAIARRHDVHPNLVHIWRRQARSGVLADAPEGEVGFTRVAVSGDGAGSHKADGADVWGMIELVLRNGRVMRFGQDAGPAQVVQLADALERSGR